MILSRLYIFGYLMLVFSVASCQNQGEDALYLIPKNFEGNLLIIYEQENGSDTSYEDGKRVYHFDSSGVLRTKFKVNYGLQKNLYFYVDSVGKRTALKYLLPSQLKSTDEVVCLNQETGKDFDKSKLVNRHFELLTVARQKNIPYFGNQRSSFMWKELDSK